MICSQNTTYFSILSILIGALLPLLIPLIHFGVVSRLWDQYSFSIDIYNCRNTCWDTVFKGNIYITNQIPFFNSYECAKPLTSLINLFQVLSKKDQNMDHLTNTFTSIAT